MQINLCLQQDLMAPEAVIYMLKHFGDLGHSLYFACTENSYPNLSSTLRKYERRKKKSMNDAQLHLSSESSRIVFSKQYPQPNLCLIIVFLLPFLFC